MPLAQSFSDLERLSSPFAGLVTLPSRPGARRVFASATHRTTLSERSARERSLGPVFASRASVRKGFDSRFSGPHAAYRLLQRLRRASTPDERSIIVRESDRGPFPCSCVDTRIDALRDEPCLPPRRTGVAWRGSRARERRTRPKASAPPRGCSRAPGSPTCRGGGAGDSHPSHANRPRLASAVAPRRAATSDEPRCFPPFRNPGARGLLLARGPDSLSRRPSLS